MRNSVISLIVISLLFTIPIKAEREFFPWWGKKTAKDVVEKLHKDVGEYLKLKLHEAGESASLSKIIEDLEQGFLWTLADHSAVVFFSYTDGTYWPKAYDAYDKNLINTVMDAHTELVRVLGGDTYKDYQTTTSFFLGDSKELAFTASIINSQGATTEITYEGPLK